MAFPSYTYTFTNGTTADATQVNQNFTDILNGISDTTKDISVSALTAGGAATLNGNVTLGNGSAKTLTVNASLSSSIPIATNTTYDLGSATLGMRALYVGGTSTFTTKIASAATASWTLTLPTTAGSANGFLKGDGSGNLSWVSTMPTVTVLTTGTGATYTTPANVLWIRVRMVGGGGGSAGTGTAFNGGNGVAGGNTTFSTLTANGGAGGKSDGTYAAGGTASGGDTNLTGGGGGGRNTISAPGAAGGVSFFGGNGAQGEPNGGAAQAAAANSGSGGGGAGSNGAAGVGGGSGAAGGYCEKTISPVSATYTYTVGAAGTAGTVGTSGSAGAAGGAGLIIVEEYYR